MKKIFTSLAVLAVFLPNHQVNAQTTNLTSFARTTLFETDDNADFLYRIPSITVLNDGTLMAFSDRRNAKGGGDIGRGNTIDILTRTSSDNGKTWSDPVVTLQSNASATDIWYAFGDCATVVDKGSGKILLMNAAGKNGYNSSSNSGNSIRIAKSVSTDNGKSWTTMDVSSKVYASTGLNAAFFSSGRICQSSLIKVSDYYRIYAALACNVGTQVVYSDDFGETWNVLGSTSARPSTSGNESKLVELPNGNVLLSCRTSSSSIHGRYFNIFTYSDRENAEGEWGSVVQSGGSTSGSGTYGGNVDGEILLVPAKDDNGNSVNVLLQSIAYNGGGTNSDRKNVGIYYKVLSSEADYDAPSDMQSGWTWRQVSTTTSAYSTMTLDQQGNIAFFFEENLKNSNMGYDMQFISFTLSQITNGKYTYDDGTIKVNDPVFTPGAGTYNEPQSVSLSCATQGANIYFTTDGSTPTSSSGLYSEPISVSTTTTIKAIAMIGEASSNVVSSEYIIDESAVSKPLFSLSEDTYAEAQSIEITCETSGATIYYTTDGSIPNDQSEKYSTAITISETTTIKAIAVKDGICSEIATATYTISEENVYNVKPEPTNIYTIKAVITNSSGDVVYSSYLRNKDLTMECDNTKADSDAPDDSYYWVLSQAPNSGYYYFSSFHGDGYIGKAIATDYSGASNKWAPGCTDDSSNEFEITDFVKSGYISSNYASNAEEMTGYAIKYVNDASETSDKKYRFVAVSNSGELNFFSWTSKYTSLTTGLWSSDFIFTKVTSTDIEGNYGTFEHPKYYGGFKVKFARSDDDYTIKNANEDFNYYATLKLPFAITIPSGVKAYKLGSLNPVQNSSVNLTKFLDGGSSESLDGNGEGATLPRETPVLLQADGEKGDGMPSRTLYFKPATAEESVETGFAGTLGRKVLSDYNASTGSEDGSIYYILAKKDGRVAFYYLEENASGEMAIGNNKAYYIYSGTSAAKPSALSFSFGDETTGIGGIKEVAPSNGESIYDLSGRHVSNPSKGVYIRGGKKFVIR